MHKNIGCANNWTARTWILPDGTMKIEKPDTTPDEFNKCVGAKHPLREVKKGHCWYQVFCDQCMLTWEYDCSG